MIVQAFLSVRRRHPSGGWWNEVERRPESLHDLSVDPSGTLDEVGSISDITAVLMTMNVPQPDARNNLQSSMNGQIRVVPHALVKVLVILTVYVVESERSGDAVHVVLQCFAQSIVHIHLPA
jgi:hypothetical protein